MIFMVLKKWFEIAFGNAACIRPCHTSISCKAWLSLPLFCLGSALGGHVLPALQEKNPPPVGTNAASKSNASPDSNSLPDENRITGGDSSGANQPQSIIVVQGAAGTEEFEAEFRETCSLVRDAARKSDSDFCWIGAASVPENQAGTNKDSGRGTNVTRKTDKQQLRTAVEARHDGNSQLWIILVGHGTYDRKHAKFNLRGPDVSAQELNQWLEKSKRPVAIINCSSSSAPFINQLAVPGRVVVTATKSGFELNYAKFGLYFAKALSDLEADIDKDEQVSLLESFLSASRKVEEFYRSESRLATEHALIDDNGDGKGTPLGFFQGVQVIKRSADASLPDGPLANQIHLIQSEFEKRVSAENRRLRKKLELQIETLRTQKGELQEEDYFRQLEEITLKLAKLYQSIEQEKKKETRTP